MHIVTNQIIRLFILLCLINVKDSSHCSYNLPHFSFASASKPLSSFKRLLGIQDSGVYKSTRVENLARDNKLPDLLRVSCETCEPIVEASTFPEPEAKETIPCIGDIEDLSTFAIEYIFNVAYTWYCPLCRLGRCGSFNYGFTSLTILR